MSTLQRVELSPTEDWPTLAITDATDADFDASLSVVVPAGLIEAVRASQQASYDAEQALLKWLRENEPGYWREHLADAWA